MKEYAWPQAEVAYVPGATFSPVQQEARHARLCYATQPTFGKLLSARGHSPIPN